MRVGIIAANNITFSPYIFFYTSILKQVGADYELIIANRNNLDEKFEKPLFVIPWNNKQKSIINYIKYAKEVKQIIKKQKYDLIIVLTTLNLVFLSIWLRNHYRKKYIVDIRDYSHENIYPYYYLEKIGIENSLTNIISSRKFDAFLPKAEYHVCHNINEKAGNVFHFHKTVEKQIRIGYVGGLDYIDQCKRLMGLISNDSRFLLDFYGTSSKEGLFRDAAKEFMCDRIAFHGAYLPQEKESIIKKVDILFNAYGNGCPLLDYALSNKLYDALIYKKPILTSPNTYMEEMAGPLSFSIDFSDERLLDKLYEWYWEIDSNIVDKYANSMISSIIAENRETITHISECLMRN